MKACNKHPLNVDTFVAIKEGNMLEPLGWLIGRLATFLKIWPGLIPHRGVLRDSVLQSLLAFKKEEEGHMLTNFKKT